MQWIQYERCPHPKVLLLESPYPSVRYSATFYPIWQTLSFETKRGGRYGGGHNFDQLRQYKDVKDEVKHIVTVVESPTGIQVEGPVDRSRGPYVFDICEVWMWSSFKPFERHKEYFTTDSTVKLHSAVDNAVANARGHQPNAFLCVALVSSDLCFISPYWNEIPPTNSTKCI